MIRKALYSEVELDEDWPHPWLLQFNFATHHQYRLVKSSMRRGLKIISEFRLYKDDL